MTKFGDFIKKWRTENKLTRLQAANRLYVYPTAIYKWEKEDQLPSFSCLMMIHKITGCDWSDIC